MDMYFLKLFPQNFNSKCQFSIWLFKSGLLHRKQIHFQFNLKIKKTKQPNLTQGQTDIVLVVQLNQNSTSGANYDIVLPYFLC